MKQKRLTKKMQGMVLKNMRLADFYAVRYSRFYSIPYPDVRGHARMILCDSAATWKPGLAPFGYYASRFMRMRLNYFCARQANMIAWPRGKSRALLHLNRSISGWGSIPEKAFKMQARDFHVLPLSGEISEDKSENEILELREWLEKKLPNLTTRERLVVKLFQECDTLVEIGERIGVCRERSRQIFHGAVMKIRAMWRSDFGEDCRVWA